MSVLQHHPRSQARSRQQAHWKERALQGLMADYRQYFYWLSLRRRLLARILPLVDNNQEGLEIAEILTLFSELYECYLAWQTPEIQRQQARVNDELNVRLGVHRDPLTYYRQRILQDNREFVTDTLIVGHEQVQQLVSRLHDAGYESEYGALLTLPRNPPFPNRC